MNRYQDRRSWFQVDSYTEPITTKIISKYEDSEHFWWKWLSVRHGEEAVAAFTSSPSIDGGGGTQPQHRGRWRRGGLSTVDGGVRRRQPQRRGQRRGGLNLSWGWHSCKYCQARFFFTAFGAPNSLQFQALNIPQWTSLQCLVSSIYNYIYFILPFWPLFLFGAFGMAFLIVLLSKSSHKNDWPHQV